MVLVVGGGVNGLSTAWGLAERGADVVLIDKGRIGGGASGIAGGIVRNYYRSEHITALVRMSVEMFEEDPEAYGFHQVGYIAAVPQVQVPDLIAIRDQHERAGYASELVLGADSCTEYLRWRWSDWEAPVEAQRRQARSCLRKTSTTRSADWPPRCPIWGADRSRPRRGHGSSNWLR